ncbi:hypothetical protein K438DRAFT_1761680 [Mycena galopus ATCC 62051]|nr:hypothetical protein K438DRAFT_1761680 [Mycena galopus ATCC 62051]
MGALRAPAQGSTMRWAGHPWLQRGMRGTDTYRRVLVTELPLHSARPRIEQGSGAEGYCALTWYVRIHPQRQITSQARKKGQWGREKADSQSKWEERGQESEEEERSTDAGPTNRQVNGVKRAIRRNEDVRRKGGAGRERGTHIPSGRCTAGCYGRSTVDVATSSRASAPGDKIEVKAGVGNRRAWAELQLCRASKVHGGKGTGVTDVRCGEWKHSPSPSVERGRLGKS